jgi:hypothetical protein
LVALSVIGVVSDQFVATLLVVLILGTAVLSLFSGSSDAVREIARDVALGQLFSAVFLFEFMGVLAASGDWPRPGREFFETTAQINATLLVAFGLTVAAPAAWRRTLKRMSRGWRRVRSLQRSVLRRPLLAQSQTTSRRRFFSRSLFRR